MSSNSSKALDEEYPVDGNRIINLKHMANNMICSKCKNSLLLQNIVEEVINGLAFVFRVYCNNCSSLTEVPSGKKYTNPAGQKQTFSINSKVALGALHTGMGHTHVDKLFKIIDLPGLSSKTFKKHERIVGPVIEQVAKESCIHAVQVERKLTLQNVEDFVSDFKENKK